MEWLKNLKQLVEGLDELVQKLHVIAAVISTMIDVKGESESKQQQQCNFSYDHFLDSVWTSCGNIISFLNTIVECYTMKMLFFSHEICMLFISNNSISIGFKVVYENPSQVPEYLQPHVSYILSYNKSSSTQLKELLNWSNISNFLFPNIMLSIESISKFLSARRKHHEQRKPSLGTFFAMFLF